MLVHAAAFNLSLLMRKRFGVGTPVRYRASLPYTLRSQLRLLQSTVCAFFRRIRCHFPLPEPNVASSRRKTRFLHHNTAPARLFSLPPIIRRAPISATAC